MPRGFAIGPHDRLRETAAASAIFGHRTELGPWAGTADREPPAARDGAGAPDFVVGLSDHVEDAPYALPNGAGDVADIMQRIHSEVLFGRMSPKQAAAKFRTEAEAAIG